MAYELADYYGGVATPAQLAALKKARAARAAQRAAEKIGYDNPIGPKYPPFEYEVETKTKGKCRKNPKKNPNRSKYMACKLRTLYQIPCEYRTKENKKALTSWATTYCPSKQRKKGLTESMAQLKAEAKKLGIRVTHIVKGKRVAKSKRLLLRQVLDSPEYN